MKELLRVMVVANLLLLTPRAVRAGETVLKTVHFDRDPGWDNSNNRERQRARDL